MPSGSLEVRCTIQSRALDDVGAAIGKADLMYKLVPATQLKPVLMQIGMSSNMADLLLEMADALNSGHMKMLEPRSPANTTQTTLETLVAETFLPAMEEKRSARRHDFESHTCRPRDARLKSLNPGPAVAFVCQSSLVAVLAM